MDFLSPTLPFLAALQRLVWLKMPMLLVSALGEEHFFLLLLPLIYWCLDRERGARLGLLLLFSVLVNDVCKVALAAPRPFWSDGITSWSDMPEASFGFPSGHAQNAAVIWTFLALRSQRPRLWVPLALGLVALISFSRLALGMHYPTDILGGLLIGFAILGGALKIEPTLTTWWRRQSPVARLVAGCVLCLGLTFLDVALVSRLHAAFPTGPTDYYAIAVANVLTWKDFAERAGSFLGLVAGLAYAAPFCVAASPSTKSLRFLVGALGIAVLYLGLKPLLPKTVPFDFARYLVLTLWVSLLAPLVFGRLRLVKTSDVIAS